MLFAGNEKVPYIASPDPKFGLSVHLRQDELKEGLPVVNINLPSIVTVGQVSPPFGYKGIATYVVTDGDSVTSFKVPYKCENIFRDISRMDVGEETRRKLGSLFFDES